MRSDANDRHRRPAAFRLDDPQVVVTPEGGRARTPRSAIKVVVEPEPSLPVPAEPHMPPHRRLPWPTLFWSATGGLAVLGIGLMVTQLVQDLFDRNTELGWLGAALAAVAAFALIAIIAREAFGLARLAGIETLRQRGVETLISDDRTSGRAVVRDVLALTRTMPRLARARAECKTISPRSSMGRI